MGNRRGKILIEFLVATALLLLALLVFSRMVDSAVRTGNEAQYLMAATNLARAEAEQARSLKFDQLKEGEEKPRATLVKGYSAAGAGDMNLKSQRSVKNVTDTVKSVQITVTWQDLDEQTRSYSLETYVSK